MEKVYNQLTAAYDQLFIQHINEFKEQSEKNRKYAAFYPVFGTTENEPAEFLIYGQAVKGWGSVFNTSEELDENAFLREAILYSNDRYKEKNHSPLDWVNVYWSQSGYSKLITTAAEKDFYPSLSYSTARSFFWNVIYKLICRYYKLDENSWDWAKKIVWSNLYKIAPAEMRNPDDDECRWQETGSVALIKRELDEIKPRFCIVITNDAWWQPFRTHLKTTVLHKQKDDMIESVETYGKTRIIVTTRPFAGNSDKHASRILELLG